jgi:hypothetical protein
LKPSENFFLPIVSALSARMGPKLWVERLKTPSAGSSSYVKPEAGDGSGTEASWLAREMLNWVNSAWKALLKWAECVLPSGSSASLFTMRPLGPYRLGMRNASFPSWALTMAGLASAMTAASRIANLRMTPPVPPESRRRQEDMVPERQDRRSVPSG